MTKAIKNAILKTKVDGTLYDVFVKTGADNVYVDGTTTLADKLTEIVTDLSGKATSDDVQTAVSTAVDNLIDGAPDTYNTLKEIADYIASHEDVVTALNAAIGNKADKTAVDALQSKLDNMEAFNPDNKDILTDITADDITNWNGKAKITFAETQPDNMQNGDVWVQLIAD